MKPKAIICSSDKNFAFEFSQLSGNLDVETSTSNLSQASYQYVYVNNDSGFLKRSANILNKNIKTVVACSANLSNVTEVFKDFSSVKILHFGQLLSAYDKTSDIYQLISKSLNGRMPVPVKDMPLNAISSKELIDAMHESSFTYFSNQPEKFYVKNDLTFHSLLEILKQENLSISPQFVNNVNPPPSLPENSITLPTDRDYINSFIQSKKLNQKKKISFRQGLSLSFSKDSILKYSAVIFSIPLVLFIVSAFSLYIGFWALGSNTSLASYGFKVAKNTSLHNSFRESAKLGERVLAVSDSTEFNFEDAKPDELRSYLSELQIALNALYKDMSFNKDSYLFSELITNSRDTVLKVHDVLEVSQFLLGLNKESTYAIAFEDNNSVTGVMIVEVKDGRVAYSQYYSADEIDTSIPGRVPAPFDENIQWQFEDVTWGGDFNLISESVRWFLDKSVNLRPDNVVLLSDNDTEFFRQYLSSNKSLLDMEFLKYLLQLSNKKQIRANSNNIRLQAFFENQSMSSGITTEGNQIMIDEFSNRGVEEKIKREVSVEINYDTDAVYIIYNAKYKNNTGDKYSFWPKIHLSDQISLESVNYLRGDQHYTAYPKTSKTNKSVTVTNFIELERNEELLIQYHLKTKNYIPDEWTSFRFLKSNNISAVPVDIKLQSNFQGIINTTPPMNLTSQGELRYTTALEDHFDLEIKTN